MLYTAVHFICSTVVPSANRCPPLHVLVTDVEISNEDDVAMILFFVSVGSTEHGIAGEYVSGVPYSFSFA